MVPDGEAVLIESDWNLKQNKEIGFRDRTRINRIRLEFKEIQGRKIGQYSRGVLIESDWNLKPTHLQALQSAAPY